MIRRFFRSFFFAVLVASVVAWGYLGMVSASTREAVLIDDRFTGVDEEIVQPGSTRFVPALAVPGRVRLHRVTVRPRVLDYPFRAGLERAEILGLDDSFYVRIQSRLEYELNPESLTNLFKKLDRPDWSELDRYIVRRVRVLWNARFSELYTDDDDIPELENAWREYFTGRAREELNTLFAEDGLVFSEVEAVKIYVPDQTAYLNVLGASADLLEEKLARIRRIEDAEARQAAEMIEDRAYYDRLEKIGGLLRKFPELKDYLAIDRLSDNVEVMVMPYDRWFPGEADRTVNRTRRGQSRRARERNPGAGDAAGPGAGPGRAPPPLPGGGFRDLTPP